MSSIQSSNSDFFIKKEELIKENLFKVLLPLPLSGCYDYNLPPDIAVNIGDFVVVPLGNRKIVGVIWGRSDYSVDNKTGKKYDIKRIKNIQQCFDMPPLPLENIKFINWLAEYNMASLGAVLKMAMSVKQVFEPVKTQNIYVLAVNPPINFKMTKSRQLAINFIKDKPLMTAADIAKFAGISVSVVKGLADVGVLNIHAKDITIDFPQPSLTIFPPILSPEQDKAAAGLNAAVKNNQFSVKLLDGVTGSGKTEVYFEAIKQCLKSGKQAVILLPEISLSSQWLSRFKQRFATEPALWHSDMTMAKRRDTWRAVNSGAISVLVGARSALHLPFPNLGLIIIDEEHDQAFKQEEGVIYNARDMAVVRAQICQCPLILVSATPSLETMVNVKNNRYQHLHLKNRHGNASLPVVKIIDLRQDRPPRQRWISPTLENAVTETLAAGEQVLLFLNRRGYAPLTLCRNCGFRIKCPNCTAWLVEHRNNHNHNPRLECHHCGYNQKMPDKCPQCEEVDSLHACGPGVERLAEEALSLFPTAKMEIITSETINTPRSAEDFINRVMAQEINLIIGTQIIAKGYHFPMLTLVGVIDADLGLMGGDLRAGERTFQLLHQVSGRAGRAEFKGKCYIQTANPETAVIDALLRSDRDGFINGEIAQRQTTGASPFKHWAGVIISGKNQQQVDDIAQKMAQFAPYGKDINIMGPVDAPLAMLRGKHRKRFLLICHKKLSIQKIIKHWLGLIDRPSAIKITIDIDPYSFM